MKYLTPALRIALIYAFFGALWITLSDTLLNALVADIDTRASIQTYKGWLYILCTASLVFAMVQAYTNKQRKAQKDLKRSQQRYRDIVEDQTEMICRQDILGSLTFVNPAFARHFNHQPDQLIGQKFTAFIQEQDKLAVEHLLKNLNQQSPTDDIHHHETLSNGSDRFDHWTHRAIIDDEGQVVEYQSTGRDITEEQLAAKRQAILVDELDHRVKNNLAVVISLAKETIENTESLDAFRETFIGRIQAMSSTHEALAKRKWKGIEFGSLLTELLDSFGIGEGNRIQISGPEVHIPASAVQPLGLAINELATNASKYGALSSLTGIIEISWHCDDNERVTLKWSEKQGPTITPPKQWSTGLALVKGLIEYELLGSLDLDFQTQGLSGLVIFSVAGRV